MKVAITTAFLTVMLFLAVMSSYAQGDLTSPVLVDLQIDPAMVDTADSSQVITFTAHITDDLSGFKRAWLLFRPLAPETQRLDVDFSDQNRISGTDLDGVYLDTATIPQYAAEGRWLLDTAQIEDTVGNLYNSRVGYDDWPANFYDYHFANGTDTTATPTITPMPKLYLPLIERME